ncbi:MAG: hypothetical protein ABGZ35_11380 [Planctomycetaceae bacterium]
MAVPDRAEVRHVTDSIRRIIDESSEPADADMSRLYRNYTAFVESVNEELEECDNLLDRNQASDAVQRAERSNLLELVATLQFPDCEEWGDYTEERGYDRPLSLSVAAASRLSKCYGPAHQREPLLRELRWHSLAQSPLRLRLEVLWRLHEADSEPDTWEPDIVEFETERFEQIAVELEQADSSADVKRLSSLYRELKKPNWISERDKKLLSQARKSLLHHRARRARGSIPPILKELRNAESGGRDRIDDGRRLMLQLGKKIDHAMLKKDNDIFRRAREAVEWVELIDDEEHDEAEYQDLLKKLEHALNEGSPREALRQIEQKLEACDDGIPSPLQTRLDSTYDDMNLTDRRRFSIRITTTAVSVICIAGLLLFLMQYRSKQNEFAKHQEALGTLVERKDFSATIEYVEKLRKLAPHILRIKDLIKIGVMPLI